MVFMFCVIFQLSQLDNLLEPCSHSGERRVYSLFNHLKSHRARIAQGK